MKKYNNINDYVVLLGKTLYEDKTNLSYKINKIDIENSRLLAIDNYGNSCIIELEQIGTVLNEK